MVEDITDQERIKILNNINNAKDRHINSLKQALENKDNDIKILHSALNTHKWVHQENTILTQMIHQKDTQLDKYRTIHTVINKLEGIPKAKL